MHSRATECGRQMLFDTGRFWGRTLALGDVVLPEERSVEGAGVVRAILWDMDGVLADTGEAHYRAWVALLAERGQTVTRKEFDATFGMANPEILRRWWGGDTPVALIAELAARKEALYRVEVLRDLAVAAGVLGLLSWARGQGIRQVVASSGEMANIAAVIGALGIANHFDAFVSGAFLPRSKPDPEIFLRAAAAVGSAPEDCLVIEDAIAGVEGARRAGMRCIAVTTTHEAAQLAGADVVVASPAGIETEAVARLLGLDG